ncbi:DUF4174 domain-containing protein [Agarivorans sp. B2Z047]|uniref:DUF4174 domain-containing protein n=1 Tax=Agarivorans sp. B2Z047 TaxID=2652721 RepID=UPI00128B8100|nr:DUF4174 domain-containing protein [Agarivorans sp. B2Z047]MPW29449.1 DUF4174 domain-containing protein [Agarivorans sp. B2Z047]UQN45038.1 DUF4174 domain-containing protein [Agarivorans sp. B2Z047]
MKQVIVAMLLSISGVAMSYPLDSDYWAHRSVLFFAPQQDHAVEQFLADEMRYRCQIQERDLVVVVMTPQQALGKTGPVASHGVSYLRDKYKVEDNKHIAVLIGKDGHEKHRWGATTNWQEVFEIIDAMPMRKQEMLNNTSVCSA